MKTNRIPNAKRIQIAETYINSNLSAREVGEQFK